MQPAHSTSHSEDSTIFLYSTMAVDSSSHAISAPASESVTSNQQVQPAHSTTTSEDSTIFHHLTMAVDGSSSHTTSAPTNEPTTSTQQVQPANSISNSEGSTPFSPHLDMAKDTRLSGDAISAQQLQPAKLDQPL
jgi:hypothetical protein